MPDEPKADELLVGTKVQVTVKLDGDCPFTEQQVVDAALRLFLKTTKHKYQHQVIGLPVKKVTAEGKDTAAGVAAAGAAKPVPPSLSLEAKVKKSHPRAGSGKDSSTGDTGASKSGPAADTHDDKS